MLNYNTYDQGMILFDVMGFGKPMDNIPMLLEPGVLTMAWGSVVHQIAAGLGVELDEIEEFYERLPATETFDIDSGTIEEGTVAALHFEVRGKVGGKDVDRAGARDSHSTTTSARTGRSRPARAATASRSGASRTTRWTFSCSAPTATTTPPASRPPRCGWSTPIPPSSDAKPGLVTSLDLPLVTGQGLIPE